MIDAPCECSGCRRKRFAERSPFCPFCDDAGLHFHCSKCDEIVMWPKLGVPLDCKVCGAPIAGSG